MGSVRRLGRPKLICGLAAIPERSAGSDNFFGDLTSKGPDSGFGRFVESARSKVTCEKGLVRRVRDGDSGKTPAESG